MVRNFLQKSLTILYQRQTNILSAAFVIMATVILSQVLGLIRQRLLVSIFGASDTLGIYYASGKLPDFLFQLIIASALSSAFIPIFSDFLVKDEKEKAHKMASTLLCIGMLVFILISITLFIFAPFFMQIFNIGAGFSVLQMQLMVNLMRILIFSQLLFTVGIFLTAVLQSYDHFFIPGFALALYNLGIIIGILCFSSLIGIYSAAVGTILGAIIFIVFQLPLMKKVGFNFTLSFSLKDKSVLQIGHLMWPRVITNAIFYFGSIIMISLISYLSSPGRNYVIFDLAQTLAFAPVALIGQAISQAAFPVLSREKNNLENFKTTFLSSFNQMLYMVLPISVLILVLRIPIVRLVYGAPKLDWVATVLTGRTLAFFAISIFAQSLIILIYKAFYALHDSKIPLIVGSLSTFLMLGLSTILLNFHQLGIQGLAISYSVASFLQLIILLYLLNIKVGGFAKVTEAISLLKFFFSTILTALALYLPLKLLDRLVFDTTKTFNLLILTGICSLLGLLLYLFLTWLFNVKEAQSFILMFKKVGNWREILEKSDEVIDGPHVNP